MHQLGPVNPVMRVVVEVACKNRSLILCRCHSTDVTSEPTFGQLNRPRILLAQRSQSILISPYSITLSSLYGF